MGHACLCQARLRQGAIDRRADARRGPGMSFQSGNGERLVDGVGDVLRVVCVRNGWVGVGHLGFPDALEQSGNEIQGGDPARNEAQRRARRMVASDAG